MSKEPLVPGDGLNLRVLARLEATGLKTVSGYSSAYDNVFPTALDGIISRREFKFCVDVLNQTVEDYFPCLPCYGCGYLWCILTCGLMLCFPEPCTKQLSDNMELVLRRLNNREELLYREIAQLVYE